MSDIQKVTFATLSAGQPLLDHMRSVMAVMNTDALGDGYEVVASHHGWGTWAVARRR